MKRLKWAAWVFISSLSCSPLFADGILSAETNWTGFYAGLNIGALKHTMNITDTNATTFLATLQQTSSPDFSGGFQVGYRQQMIPNPISGVWGVELSVNFSDASNQQAFGSPFALYQLHSGNRLNALGLLQFVGGIAADRTFLFLAAGLSLTDITGSVVNQDGIPFFNAFSVAKTGLGTALSAGFEYAFTPAFSARFKVDGITPAVYSTFDDVGDMFQISNNIVQGTFGVNYKFG